MSDEQLRQLYARATGARTNSRRADCPAPETLEALAQREGPEDERLRTLDHVMACADCRQEFELFRAIAQAGRADTGASVRRMRWSRPVVFSVGAALAAGVALVAVLGPRATRDRGREPSGIMRGAGSEVALATPGADTIVARGNLTFVWRSVPDARRYILEVLTPAGGVRVRRETRDTVSSVPAAELGAGDLRWSVRAQMDGGELHSPTRRLRVSGP